MQHCILKTIHFPRAFNSWTISIKNAKSPNAALNLYKKMHRKGLTFDSFSILFALKHCTQLRNHDVVRTLHGHLLKLGFGYHVYVGTALLRAYLETLSEDARLMFDEMPERSIVSWNIMVTGLSRIGDLNGAREVFEEMPVRDVASWGAMIGGYVGGGRWRDGLELFREGVGSGEMGVDQIMLGTVLCGCGKLGGGVGCLTGRSVHGVVVRKGWEVDEVLGTILVDMYAKFGFLRSACCVVAQMGERSVSCWSALIHGSARHGYSNETLRLFRIMQETGVRPNELTFTGVLSACANSGMVEEGRKFFRMIKECGLEPTVEHYGCMVNMFGKAGLLEEAYETIRTMEFEPNNVVWNSYLLACRDHKKFEMAERVTEQVFKTVKPDNDCGVYTILYDIYNGRDDGAETERLKKLFFGKNRRTVHPI